MEVEKCGRCGNEMKLTSKGVIYCECWTPEVVENPYEDEWNTIFYPEKNKKECLE